MKCLEFGIAKMAGEIASAQPNEHRRVPDEWSLALQRRKNLDDFERRAVAFFRWADGVGAEHVASLCVEV